MDSMELETIEAQEAEALKETQRLRRVEAARVAKAEAEKAAAEAAVLLPRAEVVSVIGDAILKGDCASLDFEGTDGARRRAVVSDVAPRVTKELTLEMRGFLNIGGARAFDVLMWAGFMGLKDLWKPGKSSCMDDKGFMKLFRALQSLESNTDCMTQSAYNNLLPVLKLMKRRAK